MSWMSRWSSNLKAALRVLEVLRLALGEVKLTAWLVFPRYPRFPCDWMHLCRPSPATMCAILKAFGTKLQCTKTRDHRSACAMCFAKVERIFGLATREGGPGSPTRRVPVPRVFAVRLTACFSLPARGLACKLSRYSHMVARSGT